MSSRFLSTPTAPALKAARPAKGSPARLATGTRNPLGRSAGAPVYSDPRLRKTRRRAVSVRARPIPEIEGHAADAARDGLARERDRLTANLTAIGANAGGLGRTA